MTNPVLKGDRPKWFLTVAIALFALVILLSTAGKGSSFLAPRQDSAHPTYTVTAEIPVAITLSGIVVGDRWQIHQVQKLTITPETSRWPFSILNFGGLLGTNDVTLEGCIEGNCNTADLGSLSLFGEEKLAVLEFHAIEPGDKLLVVALMEDKITRAQGSFPVKIG